MSKVSGLGGALYAAGYDLSGDTNSLSNIGCPLGVLDMTGINKFAHERIGGLHDGAVDWVSYFDPGLNASHAVLSPLPTVDVGLMAVPASAVVGNPAASMISKQINYDGTRGNDGALTFKVQAQANGFGLSWGQLLTAGVRTDTTATTGTGLDMAAASSFGWKAYLQVFAFAGTDATVKLQDSADNATWADLASGGFVQVTTGRQAQRLSVAGTATIRRYVRATTVTSAGFTSLAFAVAVTKNLVASDV